MAKMQSFKLISGGAAYNLDIGFIPERLVIENATKWATDGANVKFVWNRGMDDGTALADKCEDSSADKAIISSNGVTPYAANDVESNQQTISAATQANPCVVTVGSTSGWATGDAVRIQDVGGMTALNRRNKPFKIRVLSSTTVELVGIDSSDFAAYTSGGVMINLSQDSGAEGFAGVTLGTSVVGADGDVLYVHAFGADQFKNLGDIGA